MTDEQINAAIAEACGWFKPNETPVFTRYLPDYCTDLNAMAEAEKVLTYKQFEDYLMELLDFIDEPMLSTARQRAEAFLRALGHWEEVQG